MSLPDALVLLTGESVAEAEEEWPTEAELLGLLGEDVDEVMGDDTRRMLSTITLAIQGARQQEQVEALRRDVADRREEAARMQARIRALERRESWVQGGLAMVGSLALLATALSAYLAI